MERDATKPVVDFDHTTPEHAVRSDEILRDLRGQCPVAFTEQHGGYWVLTRYGDVRGRCVTARRSRRRTPPTRSTVCATAE